MPYRAGLQCWISPAAIDGPAVRRHRPLFEIIAPAWKRKNTRFA